MPMLWNVAASSGASSFRLSFTISGRPAPRFVDRQLAEIGQTVMPDDVTGARRRPVAADGEAVLVGVHVGIGAAGHAQMLADHACRDGQDGIGIGAFRGFLAERVEELQRASFSCKRCDAMTRFGGLDHDGDDADRLAAFVNDRRVIEVHPDLFRLAGTKKREFLILVGQRPAGKADLHHVVVEVGDLRPAFAHAEPSSRGCRRRRRRE